MATTPPPPPSTLYTLSFLLALLTTALITASLRLLTLLTRQRQRHRSAPLHTPPSRRTARVLVVLGSGGHTHEMFSLLRDLDVRKYVHRTYVVSSGDAFSGRRAVDFERGLETKANDDDVDDDGTQKEEDGKKEEEEGRRRRKNTGPKHYTLHTLPRARQIHQSLLTTPLSALRTLWAAFPVLLPSSPSSPSSSSSSSSSQSSSDMPDLIITNGPGTAVLIIYAALLLRFCDVRGAESRHKLRTVYVESFARVASLSLSARLVGWCVDRFVVQWEGLEGRVGGRAEYWGVLVA